MLAANPELADDTEALSRAAGSGHEEFVRLLLQYKPDLARKVSPGAKTKAIAELLVANGADPSKPNWLRITELHETSRRGDVEKATMLLDLGADINARDEDICSTPLGWAAKFGKKLMVELLLRRGAALELADDPEWATPLKWAKRRGHNEIVELLKRYKRDGTLEKSGIEQYEQLARDFVEACSSGDPKSIERIKQHFKLERTPTQAELQGGASDRLGRSRASLMKTGLSLDDARLVIAKLNGLVSWEQLSSHLSP